MKVFTGRSNPELAQGISDYLGIPLGKIDIQEFSDGEIWVAFEENIRNEDVFIIQSTNPPATNIWELLLILDAAKRASAKSIVAVIPYFGYGRQDRKDKPRVPISSRLFLDMVTAIGVNRIVSMDLHSPQIQGFVNVPFDHLYSRIALFDQLSIFKLNEKNGVVLANAGAFSSEIEIECLKEMALESDTLRPNVERFLLDGGKEIFLLAKGNLINLAAGDGNPIEAMDVGLALQTLSLECLALHADTLCKGPQTVPYEIEQACAEAALQEWV